MNRKALLIGIILLLLVGGVGAWFVIRLRTTGGSSAGTTKTPGETRVAGGGVTNGTGLGASTSTVSVPKIPDGTQLYFAADPETGKVPDIPKEVLEQMKYHDPRVAAYLTKTATSSAPTTPAQTTPSTDANVDSDHDGLTDVQETTIYHTDPHNPDTDGDGLTDGEEVNTYRTNPRTVDTDGDGLTDYEEVKIYHTNPNLKDTDGDGFSDGVEVSKGYNPLGPGLLKK